jgi:hypothetical protein
MGVKDQILARSLEDPAFEAEVVAHRPLRGRQVEVVNRVEQHIAEHNGGVMTVMLPRQIGKNEISAILQRRHLLARQYSKKYECWIRTAPTHKPQIVNSKKRLRELMRVSDSKKIMYPLFNGAKLQREEGYIWRVGNAAVEFLSSGPNANVVGGTASTALDMDEAHKISKEKFDEDFMPFTASTNAGTLLWGVGGNGLDTLQAYRELNEANGDDHLNIHIPAPYWMDINDTYAAHVESRIKALGADHPIILTQYWLQSIAALGRYLNDKNIKALFSGDHYRHTTPVHDVEYQMLVDVAAANEDFDPDDITAGFEETTTDSTIIILYQVTQEVGSNGLFPVLLIRNIIWRTGTSLEDDEAEIDQIIQDWQPSQVTIDAIGVGRQIAESMQQKYGDVQVNAYTATSNSVADDCYDLIARLNYSTVKMWNDDNSPEWNEFHRQAGWTQYAADKGKMKLIKPKADKHIDMIKALTYIHQNSPVAGVSSILANEGDYGI